MTVPTIDWIALVLAIATLVWAGRFRRILSGLVEIPPPGSDVPDDALPTVSVVAAARDEGAAIEDAARSWLALDLPGGQVLAVNDRSRDDTGERLDGLATEDPRLTVLHLTERPDGWLGKCHALARAAEQATGEYVLFTDGDVRLQPEGLRSALQLVVRERLDHLTVFPELEHDGLLQEALTWALFQDGLQLAGDGRPFNHDVEKGRPIGVGAFNLVRREALDRIGGHELLRLQVGDDVALGWALARSGHRQQVRQGYSVAKVHWQPGLLGTIRGLEKNAFWGIRFSWVVLVLATLGKLAGFLPPLLAFTGRPVALAAGLGWWLASWWAHGLPGVSTARRVLLTALWPLSQVFVLVTLWNSALALLRQGGIRWRGDFFSRKELVEGFLPLSWWLRRDVTSGTSSKP
ncbi:MAG: glycosyltransferase family 2 protein [Acidobacteriota bacterium]